MDLLYSRDSNYRVVRRLAVGCILVFAVIVCMRFMSPPHAPRVNIRWADSVSAERRLSIEGALHLVAGQRLEGMTWAYDLADPSASVIEALIRHPSVEDTHGLDRRRGVVADDAARGSTRVGGSRMGTWIESRPVDWLAAWSLWSALISGAWLASAHWGQARQPLRSEARSATPETSP